MAPPTSTPFTGRRSAYLDTYANTLMAQYRVDQIRRDIQNEQSQVQYLDSLIAQARQTAAGLEAALQAQPPASLEAATALLKAQYEGEDAQRRRQAGEAVRFKRQTTVTAEDLGAITPSDKVTGPQALKNAQDLIRAKGTTPERAAAIAAQAAQTLKGVSGVERLADLVPSVEGAGGKRAQAAQPRALTAQERADQEVLQQLFESTYFAGPSGIVGGYDGKAVADLRASTSAPASTSYATAEDAFGAALASVANGSLDREDFNSDEDFAYAKEIYSEAKAKKAYRNDQRVNFENSVLTARKEVADLEKKRAQQIGTTYDDPAQETLRRELTARGYTFAKRGAADEWKNAYVKLQKTPDYGAYISAHERVLNARDKQQPLAPSNKAENIAVTYTSMKNRRNEPISIEDLRKQLERVGVEGKLQEDAVAFTLAYWELGGPDQDPEMLAQQKEADDLRMSEDLKREEAGRAAKKEVESARTATRQLEEQQVADVTARRGEQAESNRLFDEYKSLIEQGYSKEEARFTVQELSKKPAPMGPAPKILMADTFAKTAIQDARREFPPPSPLEARLYEDTKPSPGYTPMTTVDDLVFGGGVVPPEPEAPQAAAKPKPKPRAPAKPAAPAAPAAPLKASEYLMRSIEKLKPGTEDYNRALDQYNALIDSGN